MAEYIEREAAIDAIMKVYVGTAGYKARERVFEAEEAVHRLPVADVAPVMHGRWVKIYENGEPAAEQHQVGVFCSMCKKMPKDRFTESDFCPNCGARMDGDSDAKAD